MAQLKVGAVPSKPVREKREDALARLLYLVCSRLLPDDLSLLGENADLAQDAVSEATFWLDMVPLGAKVHATSSELRLGQKEWTGHHGRLALTADGSLVELGQPGYAEAKKASAAPPKKS